MFNTIDGKRIGDAVRWHAADIRQTLEDAFGQSIVGVGSEVTFFRNLLQNVKVRLDGLLLPGLRFRCRTVETHQKPRVKVEQPRSFSCELADLLMVVKYRRGLEIVERSSIFYQVKLCDRDSYDCLIDPNQLELLCDWPEFNFGLLQTGGPRAYEIKPRTLEFGSYLFMLRAPSRDRFVRCHSYYCHARSYGVAPHALSVRRRGPQRVEISEFPYAMNGSEAFFNHVTMETGEHHVWNPSVDELVNALYRHLGLDPDPPGEFEGFVGNPAEGQPGFAILEITVDEGEAAENASVSIAERTKSPIKGGSPFQKGKEKKVEVSQKKLYLRQGGQS